MEPEHPQLSIRRQCELLELARSSWYYEPVAVDPYELHLMERIDEQYTATPFYGVRRMTAWLRQQGELVNHKRVARIMRQMGIQAIYPKPRTTIAGDNARRYPYLLRGLCIDRPDLVWTTVLPVAVATCNGAEAGQNAYPVSVIVDPLGPKRSGQNYPFDWRMGLCIWGQSIYQPGLYRGIRGASNPNFSRRQRAGLR